MRPYLEAAHKEAEPGCEYVIPRAKGSPNLHTYATQIIESAGVEKWDNLFNNLRASCEADLMGSQIYRPDVVLAWIGHSARVALQHYAPWPTEADYKKAVQNPVHSTAALGHQEPSTLHDAREKSLDFVKDAETQYPRQGSNL